MLPGMITDRALPHATIEDFRRAAAGPQPMPAGVAIAAVSAAFALGLVAKMLAVSARRGPPADDAARVRAESLAAAAQSSSQCMLQLAGEDIAAFEGYLAARRLPRSTESESQARQQSIDCAVRRAIDLPLAAAREAAAGVQLCSEVFGLAPPALVADLGVAASLLAGALRAFLLCAQSNVDQLASDAAIHRDRLTAETQRHEEALRQAEAVLERARAKP